MLGNRLLAAISGLFGDAKNNYIKEDENSEPFISASTELWALKTSSFVNLVVCKYKMKEYESIISITE